MNLLFDEETIKLIVNNGTEMKLLFIHQIPSKEVANIVLHMHVVAFR